MDTRRNQEDIDFRAVDSARKLIDTLSIISTDNLRNMVAATKKNRWYEKYEMYEMAYINRNTNVVYLTPDQFLKQVCYALITDDIKKLDPEYFSKALKKFKDDIPPKIPQNIQDILMVVCKIVQVVKSNSPKEYIIHYLRDLPKDSFVNLRGLDLSGLTIKYKPDLSGFNLMGVNLSNCTLEHIGLRRANLIKTNLSGSQLEGVDFYAAVMVKTKLMNANLKGANLGQANLTDAKLSGADLSNADLRHAILIGADLTDTKLKGAILSGATFLSDESFNDLGAAITAFHSKYKDHSNYDLLLQALVDNIIRVVKAKDRFDSTTANEWIDTAIKLAQNLEDFYKSSSSNLFPNTVNMDSILTKLSECKEDISPRSAIDFDDLTARFEQLKNKKQ